MTRIYTSVKVSLSNVYITKPLPPPPEVIDPGNLCQEKAVGVDYGKQPKKKGYLKG